MTVACFLAVASCDRTKVESADAALLLQTRSASIIVESDAGFLSAATELAVPVVDAGGARPLAPPSVAGHSLEIVAGTFASGSTPGDEGRDAAIEPALVDVTLGPFSIDALPYPNDPAAAPTMVGSPAEGARLCAERGARLCTELEWERTCKGPSGDPFATGATWNDACDHAPSRCASGFGARGMGFLREWTDSKLADGPVIRGGPKSGRRCAARSRALAKGIPSSMAFRCCHGDRNDAVTAKIAARPAFRNTALETSDLEKIFAEVPELSRISEGVRLFSELDVKSILARSATAADGIVFATSPILWSPEPGVELLVASGRARKTGFVVALWTLPHDHYRFASSFLLLNDAAPVALAYEPSRRKELRWTTCWNCSGEQGAVSLRDDGRVVIVQY